MEREREREEKREYNNNKYLICSFHTPFQGFLFVLSFTLCSIYSSKIELRAFVSLYKKHFRTTETRKNEKEYLFGRLFIPFNALGFILGDPGVSFGINRAHKELSVGVSLLCRLEPDIEHQLIDRCLELLGRLSLKGRLFGCWGIR